MIHPKIGYGRSILHLPIVKYTFKLKNLYHNILKANYIVYFSSKNKKTVFYNLIKLQLENNFINFICHLKMTDKKTTTQLYKPLFTSLKVM